MFMNSGVVVDKKFVDLFITFITGMSKLFSNKYQINQTYVYRSTKSKNRLFKILIMCLIY